MTPFGGAEGARAGPAGVRLAVTSRLARLQSDHPRRRAPADASAAAVLDTLHQPEPCCQTRHLCGEIVSGKPRPQSARQHASPQGKHRAESSTAPPLRRLLSTRYSAEMQLTSTLAVAAMVSAVLAAPAQAQTAPSDRPSLIAPNALAARLAEPGLVLLHVGEKAEYAVEHLPGARLVEVSTLSIPRQPGTLSLQLLPPDQLTPVLQALGITNQSRVVVYAGKDWVSPTTRVVFTLDYAGLGGRTMILDGGMPSWKAAGKPVTSVIPGTATPGALILTPRPEAVADQAWIAAHAGQPGTTIVDARNTEFYTGDSNNNGRIPRPGHVAGAVSVPFTAFFNDDNTFKSRAKLEALLEAAGAAPGTTVATYCHIGQQATVPYVVARLLGLEVKLYDGSFEEWSASANAPVNRGTTP